MIDESTASTPVGAESFSSSSKPNRSKVEQLIKSTGGIGVETHPAVKTVLKVAKMVDKATPANVRKVLQSFANRPKK